MNVTTLTHDYMIEKTRDYLTAKTRDYIIQKTRDFVSVKTRDYMIEKTRDYMTVKTRDYTGMIEMMRAIFTMSLPNLVGINRSSIIQPKKMSCPE